MKRAALYDILSMILLLALLPSAGLCGPEIAAGDTTAVELTHDDGPHVYWRDDTTALVLYFIDGEFIQREFPATTDVSFAGFAADDTITYRLHTESTTPKPETITDASRILALSDIHGEYEYFVEILQTRAVIDSARHWIWGDGHLVIVGDVFDRGDRVTECLWLIYQLEAEAVAAGGGVHFVLGNHELMPLRDDLRYVNDKYLEGISRRNRIRYRELFGPQMELGRWLRSKHTAVKVNGILFVHGGISQPFVDSAYTLSELNQRMRSVLDRPSQELLLDTRSRFLTGSLGPLWYRGFHYAMDGRYGHASQEDVDRVLAHFDARAIVVGHTGVDSVSALYDNRVFAVDIHFEEIHCLEALLWDDGVVYRVTCDGELRAFE